MKHGSHPRAAKRGELPPDPPTARRGISRAALICFSVERSVPGGLKKTSRVGTRGLRPRAPALHAWHSHGIREEDRTVVLLSQGKVHRKSALMPVVPTRMLRVPPESPPAAPGQRFTCRQCLKEPRRGAGGPLRSYQRTTAPAGRCSRRSSLRGLGRGTPVRTLACGPPPQPATHATSAIPSLRRAPGFAQRPFAPQAVQWLPPPAVPSGGVHAPRRPAGNVPLVAGRTCLRSLLAQRRPRCSGGGRPDRSGD